MQQAFNTKIVRQGLFSPGIHGLRGIAALCVILYHLQPLAGVAPPESFSFISRDFGYGVHLFFVLSAFSLMKSTEPSLGRDGWTHEYAVKRFFRIAPLFYAIMCFELGRQALNGRVAQDIESILLNLTFTFGFLPFSSHYSFVWAGWSVGIEMIFYALFPAIILLARNKKQVAMLLVISLVASYAARHELHEVYLRTFPRPRYDPSYFAFESNVCFFMFGVFAWKFIDVYRKQAAKFLLPTIALLIISSLLIQGVSSKISGFVGLNIMIFGLAFAMLCIWQHESPSKIVSSRLMNYFGERSFSMYLTHPIILYFFRNEITVVYKFFLSSMGNYAFFMAFLAALSVIMAVSEITYRLIEVPGIRLGKNICARMRNQLPA